MALKIRLARGGAKKRPYYRIVVADARSPRDGRFIEKVGTHNPLLPKDHEDRVHLVEDRIKHWLSKGAQPTDRVLRFLDAAGIMKREARNNPDKGKPGAKALERIEEQKGKAEAAKEAAAAAKEEAKAVAAAPAEEPVVEEAAPEAAAEEAPVEEAKPEEAKPEEAPAEEAKAEEAKAEETPAEEAKPEEAPAVEASEEKKED